MARIWFRVGMEADVTEEEMNDREKLIELICESINDECSAHCNLSSPTKCFQYTCIADHLIANRVTIQKHGRWIEDRYYEKPCVCSYCGAEAHYISTFKETYDYDWEENLQSTGFEEIREYIKTDYCPNCGAKMDLEG